MKSWTVHTITNKRNTSCGKFTGDGAVLSQRISLAVNIFFNAM